MLVQNWADVLMVSLQNLWGGFITFLPALVGAVIIFVIGWLVAMALEKVIERVLKTIQVDRIFDQLGFMKAVQKAGLDWEFSGFVGWLAKWFVLIAFTLAAADILGLSQVANFLGDVVAYIPNILVSAFILLAAALISDFLERVVRASMQAADFAAPNTVGILIRWAIWIFAILAVFNQLGVAANLVNTLFMGFVAFLAVAGGLAFGLGGQGAAREWLERVSKELRGK